MPVPAPPLPARRSTTAKTASSTDGGRARVPDRHPIQAVLFDVDGTLYKQGYLRALMAADLAAAAVRRPASIARAARILRTFRKTREELRHGEHLEAPLERLQYTAAADRLGVDAVAVEAVVEEWIFTRPLRRLPLAVRPGLHASLQLLTTRGIRVGALSDYPVADKLRALGIAAHFSVSLCTTDASINAFKPHPQGFWRACELWGLTPQEVLYVGDRPEIDAAGAAAAGLRCAIIGGHRDDDRGGSAHALDQFGDLPELVNQD